MNTLADYHYPRVYKQLLGYVEKHEMQVLHADRLYRHLRFKTPGTGIGYFDLITWPGSLAIRGDIGEGFLFTRERDMFPWFTSGTRDGWINPGYWSEKLDRGSRDTRVFSGCEFVAWLTELGTADDLLDQARGISSTEEAVEFLDSEGIRWDYESVESWRDYDHHFLLACHAILWGIKKYQKEAEA